MSAEALLRSAATLLQKYVLGMGNAQVSCYYATTFAHGVICHFGFAALHGVAQSSAERVSPVT